MVTGMSSIRAVSKISKWSREMDSVLGQIKEISMKYNVEKTLLFGSRARRDHSSASDYDIAIFENNLSDLDKAYLRADVNEIETLKKIDIVFVLENATDELMESIKRDGVIIYEQIGI